MNNETDDAAHSIVVGSALLAAATPLINHGSLLSASAAMLILGLKTLTAYAAAALAVSLAAAAGQFYFALRCRFDAELFARFGSTAAHYEAFDRVLSQWRLRPAPASPRPPEQRLRGALRLLRRQAWCFGVQAVTLVTALIIIGGDAYIY